MKTGDKVAIFGTLTSIENINATVVVDGPNGVKLTLKVFPECLELASDQRITVPEYVKDDLDKASQSAVDAIEIVSIYMANGKLFSEETCLWIDDHCDEFIKALAYGYKTEVKKQYIVPVPKMHRMYYRIPYDNHLDQINNTLSWLICYGDTHKTDKGIRFTMDEIKKYGLEDYERIEVQDED